VAYPYAGWDPECWNRGLVKDGWPREGAVVLDGVTVRYAPNRPAALKRVSLSVSGGSSLGIVGPSGSGKSTTLKLITRILDPHGGQVLLDGVDVASVSLDSLRRRVAVVPQDTSLFDASVEYNLRYGNASATDDDLRRAVERCNLNETLAKLKDGIHTSVGERGARLSGGERQKVSIARALLKDPTLILCDEVTSSVDAFAERDIVDTLRQVQPPLLPRCTLPHVVTCCLGCNTRGRRRSSGRP